MGVSNVQVPLKWQSPTQLHGENPEHHNLNTIPYISSVQYIWTPKPATGHDIEAVPSIS